MTDAHHTTAGVIPGGAALQAERGIFLRSSRQIPIRRLQSSQEPNPRGAAEDIRPM